MSNLTDVAESDVYGHLFLDSTWAKPNTGNGSYHMAFEAVPDEAGAGFVEATYAGYARKLVPHDNAEWNLAPSTNGVVATAVNTLTWPTPTADGPALVGYGVADASTGGNILVYDFFGPAGSPTTIDVVNGQPVEVAAGALTFALENSSQRVCDDLANAILGHLLTALVWAKPAALTMVLCEILYNKAGTGGTEKSGDGHTPANAGPNSAIWSALTQPGGVGNATGNNIVDLPFGVPTADWNGINGHVLKDGSSILMRQPYPTTESYPAGRAARAEAGSIVIGIN